MATTSTPQRNRHGAADARRAVLSSRERFWQPSELSLQPSTAHHLLGELASVGELRHIRRGLYWRGTKTPLGMAPPSPEQLVAELVPGPGVGPSGLSAANALRLSTQVPRRSEIAVPRRAPTDTGAVKFVSRAARSGRLTAQLNPTEVSVLEVLDAWLNVVEVAPGPAVKQMLCVMDSRDVRMDRLVEASATEPGQGRARLRAILTSSRWANLVNKIPSADSRTESAARSLLAIT